MPWDTRDIFFLGESYCITEVPSHFLHSDMVGNERPSVGADYLDNVTAASDRGLVSYTSEFWDVFFCSNSDRPLHIS